MEHHKSKITLIRCKEIRRIVEVEGSATKRIEKKRMKWLGMY
jgi:hypothetical protein